MFVCVCAFSGSFWAVVFGFVVCVCVCLWASLTVFTLILSRLYFHLVSVGFTPRVSLRRVSPLLCSGFVCVCACSSCFVLFGPFVCVWGSLSGIFVPHRTVFTKHSRSL